MINLMFNSDLNHTLIFYINAIMHLFTSGNKRP
jgi:hypothetical protein